MKIINVVASARSWHELMTGLLHDEKQRFSIPEAYDRDMLGAGCPVLVAIAGTPEWGFHVYPPQARDFPAPPMVHDPGLDLGEWGFTPPVELWPEPKPGVKIEMVDPKPPRRLRDLWRRKP